MTHCHAEVIHEATTESPIWHVFTDLDTPPPADDHNKKGKMLRLNQMYADYLSTQVEGAKEETFACTSSYSCWSVPVNRRRLTFDWKGVEVDDQMVTETQYVWLGKKGAVYATRSLLLNKKEHITNSQIIHEMKQWVWNKYFNK